MADAGKSLGASKMIFGSVKKSLGDSYVVTLKLLDVGRKQIDNWVAEPVSRAQATPGAVRQPVQKWFAQLTGQSAMGTVRIRGDVPGTAVALDGAPVGVIGSEDLVLNGIPAGRREILASKPGYPPVRREVNVVAGSSAEVVIDMAATAQAPRRPPGPLANPGDTSPILPPPTGGPDDPTGLATRSGSDGSKTALQVASWGTAGGGRHQLRPGHQVRHRRQRHQLRAGSLPPVQLRRRWHAQRLQRSGRDDAGRRR